MREIKFRAWLKDVKRMNYSFTLMNNPQESEDKHVIVMQYTGLKDKNGKEIYEGDIVEYNGIGKHEVIFKDGIFILSRQNIGLCEVIGNIYENPDLKED